MKNNSSGKAHINILIVALAIAASVWLVIGQPAPPPPDDSQYLVVDELPTGAREVLQLKKILLITTTPTPSPTPIPTIPPTPTPTPGNACNHDNGQSNDPSCSCQQWLIECRGGVCVEVYDSGLSQAGDCASHPMRTTFDMWCQIPGLAPGDGIYCLGKPVIYLYPEKPTLVDVKVTTPGEIFISDPLYPEDGWKDVLAYPDGTLTYQGDQYKELFYESSITHINEPTNGMTLTSNNLSVQLEHVLSKLGLNKSELEEFIEFWEPRLLALNTPFIQFSLIEHVEKERIDHVEITPEPDTRIELLVYFKGLNVPYSGKPLILPSTPPERKGFVMVEWGATIENNLTLY